VIGVYFFSILISLSLNARVPICIDAFDSESVKKMSIFEARFKSSGGSQRAEKGKYVEKKIEYSASGDYGAPNPSELLKINFAETNLPVKSWKKRRLLGNGQADLIETGERLHIKDFELIDGKILENFNPSKHQYVELNYQGEKLRAYSESVRQRNIIHQKVLDRYKNKKGHYLKKEDLDDLKAVDEAYPDQSVLAIMKPSRKRIINQTDDEIYENVQATLSIVYSKSNMFAPRFVFTARTGTPFHLPFYRRIEVLDPRSMAKAQRDMLETALKDKTFRNSKHIDDDFADKIEESYRKQLKEMDMDPKTGFDYNSKNINTYEKLTNKIKEIFDESDTFVEFTRFSKFDASDEMYNKLILEGFEQVQKEGISVIMISTDSATQRLFRSRFGFKTLGEIETKRINHLNGKEALENEYIMYMRVGSDEYNNVVEELRDYTRHIEETVKPL